MRQQGETMMRLFRMSPDGADRHCSERRSGDAARLGRIVAGMGLVATTAGVGACSATPPAGASAGGGVSTVTITQTAPPVTKTAPPVTMTVTAAPMVQTVTATTTVTVAPLAAAGASGGASASTGPGGTSSAPAPLVGQGSGSSAPVAVYFGSCAEARAAGAAPLHIGAAGYRPALDRDKDGVARE